MEIKTHGHNLVVPLETKFVYNYYTHQEPQKWQL